MPRPTVPISAVKQGDMLEADACFPCLAPRELCKVKTDPDGQLYVECDRGKHYLDGQIGVRDGAKVYVGMSAVVSE